MKAKPGEIWLADLGLAAKVRPVLVISRYDPDPPRALTIYLPLTTQHRGSRYEVPVGPLSFLDRPPWSTSKGGIRGRESLFTRPAAVREAAASIPS